GRISAAALHSTRRAGPSARCAPSPAGGWWRATRAALRPPRRGCARPSRATAPAACAPCRPRPACTGASRWAAERAARGPSFAFQHDIMRAVADKNYWVRTEHGRVWGPFTLEKLERLRGQLTEKAEASLDGTSWRPGSEFPELKELLSP